MSLLFSCLLAAAPSVPALNHFFVTVDPETYVAIRDAAVLRDFAVMETRTTKRGDMSYTGTYLYGAETYLEIFNAAEPLGIAPYGVAFGVDATGAAKATAPTIEVATITRTFDGQEIPWFDMGVLPRPKSQHVLTWMMEYVPAFLERWHPRAGSSAGVTRAAVLRRYAAVLGQDPERKLLGDIVAVDLTLTKGERDDFVGRARAYGCAVAQRGELTSVATSGGELRIRVGETNRITGAHFRLRAKAEPARHQLGHTTLTIRGDGGATWSF